MTCKWPLLPKRRGFRTEIPMDVGLSIQDPYSLTVAHDADDTIYVSKNSNRTIYKMKGNSNVISSSMSWPAEFQDKWARLNHLRWYNGRLTAVFGRGNSDYSSYWIEWNGWGNPDDYHKRLKLSRIGLWDDIRWAGVDTTRNWIVGIDTTYRYGYQDCFCRYDYDTGLKVGTGWGGKLAPLGYGHYNTGWIDGAVDLAYVWYGTTLRWYDYTTTTSRDTWVGASGTITFVKWAGGLGTTLDKYGDLWLMQWLNNGGVYNEWASRFEGISNTLYPRIII
jgi:hypothetical protein